jgi:hypothetical protein
VASAGLRSTVYIVHSLSLRRVGRFGDLVVIIIFVVRVVIVGIVGAAASGTRVYRLLVVVMLTSIVFGRCLRTVRHSPVFDVRRFVAGVALTHSDAERRVSGCDVDVWLRERLCRGKRPQNFTL